MRAFSCDCGTMIDLETLPNNSRKTTKPGKFCPVCDSPLDALALENTHSGMPLVPSAAPAHDAIVEEHEKRIARTETHAVSITSGTA